MPVDDIFYVYIHRRHSDNSIFYVGKGSGDRAWKTNSRNEHWRNVVKKHDYTVEIVARFSSEECAFSFEVALIDLIGLENLTNKSNGGRGSSGWKISEEGKRKLSEARSNGKMTWRCGVKHKASTIEKMKGHGANNDVYEFIHDNGETFTGTCNELKNAMNLSKSDGCNLREMVTNLKYLHVKGWRFTGGRTERVKPAVKSSRPRDTKLYTFTHKDGNVVVCTQFEFKKMFNLSPAGVCGIIKGRSKTYLGWSVNHG